jgi:hypothetical protein
MLVKNTPGLTVICLFACWVVVVVSPSRAHGSSVDLQLKNFRVLSGPFGEVASDTLLLEARPQAFRVPGLDPGEHGLELQLEVEL